MWDDEDNNPYGSFAERDTSLGVNTSPTSRYATPVTPPLEHSSPDQGDRAYSSQQPDEDGYSPGLDETTTRRKQSGYDSRVEQFLFENPSVPIAITHAGKNMEGGGSYIAYTIKTGDVEVRRRYRDFDSLRQTLVSLHPTLIVPPIPEKHTMSEYAAKPTKAKEDEVIIDYRKRMLTTFLNRCRRLSDVLGDGVFWKFLDPNASWTEVLLSHPVSSLPKSSLKAPPLDPANPTSAHGYLPVPATNAKLKSGKDQSRESSGTPTSPLPSSSHPSAASHSIPGQQVFARFPPMSQNLSEQDLDPYFVNFESSSRELETLLQGTVEKVNRRTLNHLGALSEDLSELGARFNGFSLSEQSATLAAAIEKIGQAVDDTYIATGDLTTSLSAGFTDPMRESAQFASIVRSVLRFRILKRIQGEMAQEDLEKKKALLSQLESSELEAQRIEQHLQNSGYLASSPPRRSTSNASSRDSQESPRADDDATSIDSDFPPGRQDVASNPSAPQGGNYQSSITHKKSNSGNFVTNKLFGRLNHAMNGIVDRDPERTRRDQIGKTKESLVHLEEAIKVSEQDVKDASAGVLRSLKQFQGEKEEDLRRYMIAYARSHIEWAGRNHASWQAAQDEIEKIEVR